MSARDNWVRPTGSCVKAFTFPAFCDEMTDEPSTGAAKTVWATRPMTRSVADGDSLMLLSLRLKTLSRRTGYQ